MKRILFAFIVLLFAIPVQSQEQPGKVKTIGRPGKPGAPLNGVVVRAHGGTNHSLSDSSGVFKLVLAHYSQGQAYSLSRVSKAGYQLADSELIGRKFPYSKDVPLVISMVSTEDYRKTAEEIEAKVRDRVKVEYDARMKELEDALAQKSINEQVYQQKLLQLLDYSDNIENIIGKLVDRYAKTDYDKLDSIDRQINNYIEQGKLDEAEALILSKGSLQQRKADIERQKEDTRLLEQTVAQNRKEIVFKLVNLANDLYAQYEIAALRHDNVGAAKFLKERMDLDSANINWAIDYAAFIYKYMGNHNEALDIYTHFMEIEKDSAQLAVLMSEIAHIHSTMAVWDKALEYYLKVAAIREADSTLTPLLSVVYGNIANIYLTKENYEEGISYLKKCEELCDKFLDREGLSGVYLSQAILYENKGDFAKAEEMLLKSLQIRMDLFGETSYNVASVYSNLYSLSFKRGHYGQAKDYLMKEIKLNREIFGDNHPSVAENYIDLGSLEKELGKYDDVLANYRKGYDIYMQFYGVKHPNTATALSKLSNYYSSVVTDYDKALYYGIESLNILKSIYGSQHSMVATQASNVASIYSSMANYPKAEEMYAQSIAISRRLYGEKSHYTADYIMNLGVLYFTCDKLQKAEELFNDALEIYLSTYGEKHVATSMALYNLASVYEKQKDYQKAYDTLLKVLDIRTDIYGKEHDNVASVYDKIGGIFYDLKIYDNAKTFLTQALEIRKSLYGEKHEMVAQSYNNIATLYIFMKEYVSAEKMLFESLEIKKALYGDSHPDIATCYSNLSNLYGTIGDFDKALAYLEDALAIVQDVYQPGHSIIQTYQYGLVMLYEKKGDYKSGLTLLKELYDMALEKLPVNDRFRGHYMKYLNFLLTKVLTEPDYNGEFDDIVAQFNKNIFVTAEVAEGSYAHELGLRGTYTVIAYDDWSIGKKELFFKYFQSEEVKAKQEHTYIFYRDGEYIKVSFSGALGVKLDVAFAETVQMELLINEFCKKKTQKRIKVVGK